LSFATETSHANAILQAKTSGEFHPGTATVAKPFSI
jgi:hypothetical protein